MTLTQAPSPEPAPTANVDEADPPPSTEAAAPGRWDLSDNATTTIMVLGFMALVAFMVYVLAEAAR